MRLVTSFVVMFAYWLLLSGHTKAWLIGAGVVCAGLVAAVVWRMGAADDEGHPIELIPRGLIYWPWLVREIILSALNVARLILNPLLPITPAMIKLKAGQKTAVGLTTYANSITLTPGTISVEVSSRHKTILVHAIERAPADDLAQGGMDRMVSWFERVRS
jgi:multicomponent Na+:H+ antiporter subunit E